MKTASHKCVPLRKSDSKSDRLPPAEQAPQPEDVCKYTWLFGEPTSDNYRWLFLPLLLCAFGRLDHGGLAQVAVGNDKWSRICSAFKTGFAKFPSCSFEALPAAPSSVGSPYEPDSIKIVHVLLNPDKNPEDIGLPAVKVDTAALGELRNFILRLRRVLKARQAPVTVQ